MLRLFFCACGSFLTKLFQRRVSTDNVFLCATSNPLCKRRKCAPGAIVIASEGTTLYASKHLAEPVLAYRASRWAMESEPRHRALLAAQKAQSADSDTLASLHHLSRSTPCMPSTTAHGTERYTILCVQRPRGHRAVVPLVVRKNVKNWSKPMSDVCGPDVDFKAVSFGSKVPWKQSSVFSSHSEPASQNDGRGQREAAGLNIKSISPCSFRFPITSGTATLDDIPVCCSPDATKEFRGRPASNCGTAHDVKI